MAGTSAHVLVAVDNSDLSERSFRWYLERFHSPAHKVSVVHVPEYWGDVQRMMSPARIQELVDETNATTHQLRLKCDTICKDNGVESKFDVCDGSEVWNEICKYAEKINANMIVIGSRGMGAIKRTLLGSVSDGVLHHCDIPILIYKERHQHHHH